MRTLLGPFLSDSSLCSLCALWLNSVRRYRFYNLYSARMKSVEFKLPENEVETEAEQHAVETRRAVSAASKGEQPMRKKQPDQRKGRRRQATEI